MLRQTTRLPSCSRSSLALLSFHGPGNPSRFNFGARPTMASSTPSSRNAAPFHHRKKKKSFPSAMASHENFFSSYLRRLERRGKPGRSKRTPMPLLNERPRCLRRFPLILNRVSGESSMHPFFSQNSRHSPAVLKGSLALHSQFWTSCAYTVV